MHWYLVNGTRHALQPHPSKARLSSVVSNKCLGVDLDDRLAFHINIEEICKKICSGIGALRRIKPFVPPEFSCYIIQIINSAIF
jgi:hypothetical protein